MQMRLRMLKHCVGKGGHVMKQLHVSLIVLQYNAIVATERAGYVLYRALVIGYYIGHEEGIICFTGITRAP